MDPTTIRETLVTDQNNNGLITVHNKLRQAFPISILNADGERETVKLPPLGNYGPISRARLTPYTRGLKDQNRVSFIPAAK